MPHHGLFLETCNLDYFELTAMGRLCNSLKLKVYFYVNMKKISKAVLLHWLTECKYMYLLWQHRTGVTHCWYDDGECANAIKMIFERMSGLLDMNNWVMLWHVKQFLKSSMWGFYHQTSVLVRIDKSWFWCWIATCHLQIERSLCHSIFIVFLFMHFSQMQSIWYKLWCL